MTMGNLNELISVGLCPIFGGARLRFYVGLYAVVGASGAVFTRCSRFLPYVFFVTFFGGFILA